MLNIIINFVCEIYLNDNQIHWWQSLLTIIEPIVGIQMRYLLYRCDFKMVVDTM